MNSRMLKSIALAATLLMLGGCSTPFSTSSEPGASRSAAVADLPSGDLAPKGPLNGPYPVMRVVDGDTIWVESSAGRLKVRLIGIDTAETVDPNEPVGCFGPEASAEANRLLAGATVYLELDPSQGDTDRYGRTLAYVWLEDGQMFNELMVRSGFAIEYTYDDPYAYQGEFLEAQAQAKAASIGLWSACAVGS